MKCIVLFVLAGVAVSTAKPYFGGLGLGLGGMGMGLGGMGLGGMSGGYANGAGFGGQQYGGGASGLGSQAFGNSAIGDYHNVGQHHNSVTFALSNTLYSSDSQFHVLQTG